MKVAFVLSPNSVVSGYSNGVRSQALAWKRGLEELGVDVTLINPWEGYQWSRFDLLHVFHYGLWLDPFITRIGRKNPNVVLSPVVDTNSRPRFYRWFGVLPIRAFRLCSIPAALRQACAVSRAILARSSHEAEILRFGRADFERKMRVVPLGFAPIAASPEPVAGLEGAPPFCLHVSSWYQERKNVLRLLQAMRDLPFRLVIAGNGGTPAQSARIRQFARTLPNVTMLDFVSPGALRWLYERAAVFCLPSTCEGVGLVALEAAHYGTEVVVTRRGGPADYFRDGGILIDPFSVASIRNGIIEAYAHPRQPRLREVLRRRFSPEASARQLLRAYQELIPLDAAPKINGGRLTPTH